MTAPLRWQRVRRGDLYLAAHARNVADLAVENTLLPGPGYRLQPKPGRGVAIELEETVAVWPHPWKPVLIGDRLKIAPGLVSMELPWLADDTGALRRLDGKDADGEDDPLGAPALSLDEELYNDEGYSWAVLQATVDPATGLREKPEDGGLTLAQTATVTWDAGYARDVDGTGSWPLVQLWRGRSASEGFGKVTAAAMFNLNHRYVGVAEGRPARHWFFV